ncbi:MAG: hypothetical protein IPJ92_08280 [Veillonella sp.]|nr:hypothetical protein [Veillonella sp.]
MGLHAIKADWGNENHLCFCLRTRRKISWDDALIAFFVFYHNYASKRKTSDIALECMNNSINNPKYFKLFNSKGIYNLLRILIRVMNSWLNERNKNIVSKDVANEKMDFANVVKGL